MRSTAERRRRRLVQGAPPRLDAVGVPETGGPYRSLCRWPPGAWRSARSRDGRPWPLRCAARPRSQADEADGPGGALRQELCAPIAPRRSDRRAEYVPRDLLDSGAMSRPEASAATLRPRHGLCQQITSKCRRFSRPRAPAVPRLSGPMEPLRYSVAAARQARRNGRCPLSSERQHDRYAFVAPRAHAHATTTPSAPTFGKRGMFLSSARHREPRRMEAQESGRAAARFDLAGSHGFSRVPPRTTRATRIHGFTADDTATRILSVQPRMTRTPRILRVQLRTTRILSDWRRTNTRLCVGCELPDARHRLQPIGTRLLCLTLRREPVSVLT